METVSYLSAIAARRAQWYLRSIGAALLGMWLLVAPAQAQLLTDYSFIASSGTYTPLAGGTSLPTSTDDDLMAGPLPLGFSFTFLGTNYTEAYVSSNGVVSFNSNALPLFSNNLANAPASMRPAVVPFWDGLVGGSGSASYLTTGTAPNRVFTVEYLNWYKFGNAVAPSISFQVKLYEATGKVQFVYRREAAPFSGSGSIGLLDVGTGAGSFLSLSDSGAGPAASTTTATDNISSAPATGQIYSFQPAPSCATMTSLTASNVTTTTAQLNFNNSGGALDFTVSYSRQGGAVQTVAAPVNNSPYTLTGLVPGITYTARVAANCFALSGSAALTTTFTTPSIPALATCQALITPPSPTLCASSQLHLMAIDGNPHLGSALSFVAGQENYGTLPRPVQDDFTIEYYVNTTMPSPSGSQWWQGPGIVDAEVTGPTNDFGTALVNGKLAFGVGEAGHSDLTILSTTSINDGLWHHVAVTRRRSTGDMEIFIDGVLEASAAGGINSQTAPANITLGAMATRLSYFTGQLDELRIWDRVRTAAEINADRNRTLTLPATGLVAYYKFDEGSGATALSTGGGPTVNLFSDNGGALPVWVAPSTAPVNTSYSWSPATGLSGTTTASVIATPAVTTTYTVTVTNTITNCTTTASTTVTVGGTNTAWYGATNTDWNTASNWSCGVPTAATDVIISAGVVRYPIITAGTAAARHLTLNGGLVLAGGTLNVTGNFINNGSLLTEDAGVLLTSGAGLQSIGGSVLSRFSNLHIGTAGAALTGPVQIGEVLTLDGNLATNGRPLTLLSNAQGTALLVNNGSNVVNGAVTVQRYIDPSNNPGFGYRHYSAPILSPPLSTLATTGFTPNVAQGAAYNSSANPGGISPFPNVFTYDETRLSTSPALNYSPFDKGWRAATALSNPMPPGVGFSVNIPASRTVSFTGTANNNPVGSPLTLALSRGPQADAGWSLVGNPYPSPLDWSTLTGADFTNADAAMYVFESFGQYAGTYRSYVAGIGDPLIASGQAFFVRASTPGAGSIRLSNANRRTTFSAADAIFYRNAPDTRPRLQLTLAGSGVADETTVYFQAGTSTGPDATFDAYKLPGAGTAAYLASVAGSTDLSINALPPLAAQDVRVPLNLWVPRAGTYILNAAQLASFAPGEAVLLLDAQTGSRQDLRLNPRYVLSLPAGSAGTRFALLFRPGTVTASQAGAGAGQLLVFPNPAHDAFSLSLPALPGLRTVQATLLNSLGQVVLHRTLTATSAGLQAELNVRGLPQGVYLLRLDGAGDQPLLKRVVVE
jgi:hypothetical protein